MVKVHGRIKRKVGVSAHKGTHLKQDKKKKRPKSFKNEELAKKWADKKKLKNFKLVNLRNECSNKKKIRIVV